MEDFVTWVDTSKLKRTIMSYNDEVGPLIIESCLLFTPLSLARRLRTAVSFRVRPTVILLYTAGVCACGLTSNLLSTNSRGNISCFIHSMDCGEIAADAILGLSCLCLSAAFVEMWE